MSCNDCQDKLIAFLRASGTTTPAFTLDALPHNVYTRRRLWSVVEFCPKCGAYGAGLHHTQFDAASNTLEKHCNRCSFHWRERPHQP